MHFFRDLLDTRCQKAKENESSIKNLEKAGLTITVLVSFVGSVRGVLSEIVGLSTNFLAIGLAILSIFGCIHIISATKKTEVEGDRLLCQYAFGNVTRQIAKLILLLLLIFSVPFHTKKTLENFNKLPISIYGYLVDVNSGAPIQNATLKIKSNNGVDVTKFSWPSDVDGFYIIELTEKVTRDAKLHVFLEGCDVSILSLNKENEYTNHGNRTHNNKKEEITFLHSINCK